MKKKSQLIEITENASPQYWSILYQILSYHILLGFFVKDKELNRSRRLIAYISILNTGLVIEGGLIYSSTFNDNTGSLALIGFIASLCTLSINVIVNISKKIIRNKTYLLTIFLFIIAITNLGIVIALAVTLDLNNHSYWGICFGWGILFNIALEFLLAIVFSTIFKEVVGECS